MSDAGQTETSSGDPKSQPLSGGLLLAQITNRIVSMMREHYGRGPIKAKTYVLDNLIVCVLTDGFTAIEKTMMEGGEPERVLDPAPRLPAHDEDPIQPDDRGAHRS